MKNIRRHALLLFCALGIFLLTALRPGEDDMDRAYQNARKGITWGLNNLKAKKIKNENKLIANDQLIASVKIEKEVNGVRIVSTGHSETTEVTVTAYRTFETLVKEGYADKSFLPGKDEE